jgi:hypothetical protein
MILSRFSGRIDSTAHLDQTDPDSIAFAHRHLQYPSCRSMGLWFDLQQLDLEDEG